MSIRAREHVRRMRGGANAHLMLGDDDGYWVVKFRNNPQHARVIVNEVICYTLLDHLGLPVPSWDVVEVSPELVAASPDLVMEAGRDSRRCEPGLHFGSRFPVDPVRQAVYDYVPLSLLRELVNLEAFLGMLPFDKWISNANGRQAVFFRDRAKDWLRPGEERWIAGREISARSLVYVVNMIDHGFAFNAHRWEFAALPEQGVYTRREVYSEVTSLDSFEPWLSRIVDLPVGVLDDAYKRVPAAWYADDWQALESLLERLYERRTEVPDLVRKTKQCSVDPFPGWALTATIGARAVGGDA